MNNNCLDPLFKPIAFYLSKNKLSNEKLFNSEKINLYIKNINDLLLYIYYIGEAKEKDKINKFLFSFPQTDDLLDRNIIITIINNNIFIENDWLGSIPIYYNQSEIIISTNPNLCLKDRTIDQEGLLNYFEFGYSVFEHTPFLNVKFLRYYSKISIINKKINIHYKNDPILTEGLFNKKSTPSDAINCIKEYIEKVENKTQGDIIIPTSGGYDSRLLNWAIKEKDRIKSYTYGVSKNQSKSSEVVYAEKLSKILNTKWEQIELGNYHEYIDYWYNMFGFATHLHGMYQIEFYKKIISKEFFSSRSTLLSGIVGDAWAGSIKLKRIININDLTKLGHTHDLNLSRSLLLLKSPKIYKKSYFENNKINLENYQIQIISTIRLKIILLSYLNSIPESFGIPVWTPFLNYKVVIKILQLPDNQKNNRLWQTHFFKTVGLDLENMHLTNEKTNSLNYEASRNFNFDKIEEKYFSNITKSSIIKKINCKINNIKFYDKIVEHILNKYKIRGLLRRIGIKKIGYLNTIHEYYILKPIEKTLK